MSPKTGSNGSGVSRAAPKRTPTRKIVDFWEG